MFRDVVRVADSVVNFADRGVDFNGSGAGPVPDTFFFVRNDSFCVVGFLWVWGRAVACHAVVVSWALAGFQVGGFVIFQVSLDFTPDVFQGVGDYVSRE